jgi:hypothetical protein
MHCKHCLATATINLAVDKLQSPLLSTVDLTHPNDEKFAASVNFQKRKDFEPNNGSSYFSNRSNF